MDMCHQLPFWSLDNHSTPRNSTTARNREVSPPLHLHQVTRGSGLPRLSAAILTRDRCHQGAQPLVLLLEGSADFPHILQALRTKEKRPIQCYVGDNHSIPTFPFHWIWYLFSAGRCMLGGRQSVLGCLIWKTQGRVKLVIGTLCTSAQPCQHHASVAGDTGLHILFPHALCGEASTTFPS